MIMGLSREYRHVAGASIAVRGGGLLQDYPNKAHGGLPAPMMDGFTYGNEIRPC
ncbi:MAG: hypothetical protein MUE60_03640 [Candidatus Eisenbacteria bacterium]|jgi:hypothetical protein|nr:hypothetical protein [Candidatus Eisenbacteria bacterium]